MKKIFFSLFFAAFIGSCTTYAQDTLWQKPAPLDNYFNNSWIDTTAKYVSGNLSYSNSRIIARQFVLKHDTLQVYGIAAMMVNYNFLTFEPSSVFPDIQTYLNFAYPSDPSFAHCEESLMLFQYRRSTTPSLQQLGDSLPVHMLYTPVSYYIMSNNPPVSYLDTIAKPVYERYFSAPQSVYDTFFVGFSQNDGDFSDITHTWQINRPQFGCLAFGYPDQRNLDEVVAFLSQSSEETSSSWNFSRNYNHHAYYIFPIIAPPDTTVNPSDTTVNPGDSLAIRPNDLIYRYTNVAPNPARNSVRITSSFGISRIEAYDLRGRRIYESPQLSTFSFPLSTIDWPRGTYLLRITTPAGPTTKKLLIQ